MNPANDRLPIEESAIPKRRLADYDNSDFDPGRGAVTRILWWYASLIFVESGWFPFSGLKVWLLRRFGAQIGNGVVIKPHVRVKYPWRLVVGNDCWIGQGVWIDNLAVVTLEDDVCISQGAYLCTGSHNHRSPTFELITRPIRLRQGSWVTCHTVILPGSTIHPRQVIGAGQVFQSDL